MSTKLHIKKGDSVIVIAGDSKNSEGKPCYCRRC